MNNETTVVGIVWMSSLSIKSGFNRLQWITYLSTRKETVKWYEFSVANITIGPPKPRHWIATTAITNLNPQEVTAMASSSLERLIVDYWTLTFLSHLLYIFNNPSDPSLHPQRRQNPVDMGFFRASYVGTCRKSYQSCVCCSRGIAGSPPWYHARTADCCFILVERRAQYLTQAHLYNQFLRPYYQHA